MSRLEEIRARLDEEWLSHPNNEPPQQVASRFSMSEQWASEHVGPHRCVDDRRYIYSCLVSDPAMDSAARSYMKARAWAAWSSNGYTHNQSMKQAAELVRDAP